MEGKLWKLGCHSGLVSQGNGLIFVTGSKADKTGEERPHQQRVSPLYLTLLYYSSFFRNVIIDISHYRISVSNYGQSALSDRCFPPFVLKV